MRPSGWGIAAAAVAVVAICAAAAAAYERADQNAVQGARTREDVEFLDSYAEELGLVMARSRGPEPEAFARRVDGPDSEVEALELSGSVRDGGAVVVLRLRRERVESEWSGAGETYQISACYRWVLGTSVDDFRPERLDTCPDKPVIELGPAPVEARLPDGIDERLTATLSSLAADGTATEDALGRAVRSDYARLALQARRPGTQPEEILTWNEIVAGDDWIVTTDEATGVAIGRGMSCVVARVEDGKVRVWRPRRVSLQPGEIGCSAAAAAAGGSW